MDESAAAALAQIKEKGYAKPYLADSRPIYCIGLNFDSKTRQLVDSAVETLS
ncbi:MAG: PD-(D/E)XK nuclease domain-containing protein [Kiritimatiellae bacterium]|nr:PD-(D/E)XK nuclease domain-containing protein [Kiritimatiellia bacterium]